MPWKPWFGEKWERASVERNNALLGKSKNKVKLGDS